MIKFEKVKNCDKDIKLPTRADVGSAGYDFYIVDDITINPGETVIAPTYVKAKMDLDVVLLLYVRSSIGLKRRLSLANGTGVIDSTFYGNPDNDGNIGIALYNYGTEPQTLKAGERVAQGVFVKYYTTVDDNTINTVRTSGFGSSGK